MIYMRHTTVKARNENHGIVPTTVESTEAMTPNRKLVWMARITFSSSLAPLGDSLPPLYYLIISSALNMALDLLFVAVFHWGAGGAAHSPKALILLCTTRLPMLMTAFCTPVGRPWRTTWERMSG